MNKMTICIDFDGVIHSYERGWQGGDIYGTIVPGFWEWAVEAEKIFELAVYSSRSATLEGRTAMRSWLKQQWEAWPGKGEMPLIVVVDKPIAFLTIDDRCIRFEGNWSDPALDPKVLQIFKAWNNK